MADLSISQAFDLAVQHMRAGQLNEAEQILRQILAVDPTHAEAIHHLGIIAHQTGHVAAALELVERAAQLAPQTGLIHSNLGWIYVTMGRLEEATASCQRAIELQPTLPDAYNNLASALIGCARFKEAIPHCQEAIVLDGNKPEFYCNLSAALSHDNQFEKAIAACQQAIALRPGFASAYTNMGTSLVALGRLEEALAAHEKAIALQPDLPQAHNNLSHTLFQLGQLDESVAACRRAISMREFPEAYRNLSNALFSQGKHEEAVAAMRHMAELSPDRPEILSDIILLLLPSPHSDAATLREALAQWNLASDKIIGNSGFTCANDRSPNRPLKIGYVSADFRRHVVGRNIMPLIREHDRNQFEVYCYADVIQPDDFTDKFRGYANHWRSIVGLKNADVAAMIHADEIDILIDLALHTADNRLLVFAYKPAPVQVTFAGYPGTTGLPAMDYRLSDPYLDPPGMDESTYAEKTLRLPHSFWCYDAEGMELPTLPEVSPLPALRNGHITFGCLNAFNKVTPRMLSLWGQVMAQTPDSHLLLLSPEGSHRESVLDVLHAQGVDPSRVSFTGYLPRDEYILNFAQIDIGLDTLPYCGHTSSLDSYWMGVPMVTLLGETVVGRAGWSQLNNLALTELAARDEAQFVQIAVSLAADLPRLAELRAGLRERMQKSPLMDAVGFTRAIEAEYRAMWRVWCGQD